MVGAAARVGWFQLSFFRSRYTARPRGRNVCGEVDVARRDMPESFEGLLQLSFFRSHETASALAAGEERVRGEVDEDARKDAPLEGLVPVVVA